MITVDLPAFNASRTSIHVSSSTKTASTASIGRGKFGSGFTGSGAVVRKSDRNATPDTLIHRSMGGGPEGMSALNVYVGVGLLQEFVSGLVDQGHLQPVVTPLLDDESRVTVVG